ncbi:MAG: acyl-CoA thioesterase [Gammaproteobacteria bacterium]
MFVSRRTHEVEWRDCDPANIVFYPNYFAWFDTSTIRHFAAAGLPKQEMIRRYDVIGFPLVDTGAKFYVPSRYGDEVTIETTITRFGRASFEVHHRLLRGETLAVEGFEKRVLARKKPDGEGIESFPIPDEIKALFDT